MLGQLIESGDILLGYVVDRFKVHESHPILPPLLVHEVEPAAALHLEEERHQLLLHSRPVLQLGQKLQCDIAVLQSVQFMLKVLESLQQMGELLWFDEIFLLECHSEFLLLFE